MRKLRLLSLLLFAIAFITINCTKEGPEGPAGATGPQGPPGSTGATGPAGTANVVYTAWTSFQELSWVLETYFGQTVRRHPITAPGVTTAMMDQGVVLVYIRGAAATQPTLLPMQFYNWTQPKWQLLNYTLAAGIINVRFMNLNDQLDPGVFGAPTNPLNQWRYILIPGGVLGGRSAGVGGTNYTADEIKAMPYEQVCQLFNVQP